MAWLPTTKNKQTNKKTSKLIWNAEQENINDQRDGKNRTHAQYHWLRMGVMMLELQVWQDSHTES